MMVYRVARHDDATTGPYNYFDWTSSPVIAAMAEAHNDCPNHMPPHKDGLLGYIDSYEHCGFESLESLMVWFEGFLPGLGKSGFVIHVFESNSARVGHFGQTVFELRTSGLLGTIPLTV